jgi:hypothetical protein
VITDTDFSYHSTLQLIFTPSSVYLLHPKKGATVHISENIIEDAIQAINSVLLFSLSSVGLLIALYLKQDMQHRIYILVHATKYL